MTNAQTLQMIDKGIYNKFQNATNWQSYNDFYNSNRNLVVDVIYSNNTRDRFSTYNSHLSIDKNTFVSFDVDKNILLVDLHGEFHK